MASPPSFQKKTAKLYPENELRQRCIRVLDLDITCTGDDEPVRGDLRVVSLDDNPTFEAISYSWGNPFPSCQIICSGKSVSITQNGYNAVRSLLCNSRISTIWIDAICINQSDDAEKNRQVPLMRDIYGRAKRTYIWLGNSTEDSDYAFDWLVEASQAQSPLLGIKFKKLWPPSLPGVVLPLIRLQPELVKRAMHRIITKNQRLPYKSSSMQDLISRDWFKRMWTIQELVMANEPLVVCGNKTIRWNYLTWGILEARNLPENRRNKDFIDTLNSVLTAQGFWLQMVTKSYWSESPVRKWVPADSITYYPWQQLLNFLQDYGSTLAKSQMALTIALVLFRLHRGVRPFDSWALALLICSCSVTMILTPSDISQERSTWEARLRSSLPSTLNRIRTRKARLPVDKVFALYGVFQELGIPLTPPDYTKSMGEVYLAFTCQLIKWQGSLEILIEASGPGIPGIPSWVPDWSKRYHRVFKGDTTAAGNSSPSFSILEDVQDSKDDNDDNAGHNPRILTKGKVFDRVAFCTPELQEQDEGQLGESGVSDEASSPFHHNVCVLMQWLSLVQQPRFHANPSNDIIIETLVKIMHSETDFSSEDQKILHQNFRDWTTLVTADPPSAVSVDSTLRCARALEAREPIYRYHLDRCNAIADKRIFLTTAEGRLGTGPMSMQTGDVVALLAGFSAPMILRERGLSYEVVGVAYIDKVMQGQAWPETETEIQQLTLV